MFHIVFLLLAVLVASVAGAQATIGANKAPDKDAVLELVSGSKGLLLPRVAQAARPVAPTAGLVIFNTTSQVVEYFNGTQWVSLQAAPAAAAGTVAIRREPLATPLPLELSDEVVVCTNSQAGELILPHAGALKGKTYQVKVAGAGNVVVRSSGNSLIDDVARYEIPGGAKLSFRFVSDGQQWNVLN